MKSNLKRGLLGLGVMTLMGVGSLQPYRPVVFLGHSMEPTYGYGTVAWSRPVESSLHAGDVVVLNTSHGRLVKRVAFLPGDRIPQMHDSGGWNDMICVGLSHRLEKRPVFRWFTVPKGRVYVLGDNMEMSLDSRTYGCFSIGEVERVIVNAKAAPHRSIPLVAWTHPVDFAKPGSLG